MVARIPRIALVMTLALLAPGVEAQGTAPMVPVPNRPANDNSSAPANTRYVDGVAQGLLDAINGRAPLANPNFTGKVTAPAFAGDGAVLTLFGRSLADRAAEVVSVLDKGADLTGSADSAGAFDAAAAAAKTWRIPPGTYRLARNVANPSDRLLLMDVGVQITGPGKLVNYGEMRDYRSQYGQNARIIKGTGVTGYEADAPPDGERLSPILYGLQVAGGDGIAGLLGSTINTLPAIGPNGASQFKQPTGVTAYGELSATASGNSVFGLFGRVDIRARGHASNELNTMNWYAAPPASPSIDDVNVPNTSATIPITLTLAAAGRFSSYAALRITQEGSSHPQAYNYGIVTRPGAIKLWNAYFAGAAGAATQNGVYSAVLGGGDNVVLKTVGPTVAKNRALAVRDAGDLEQASLRQDGTITSGASASANPLAQITVNGSETLRGLANTAAWYGVDATPGSGIGAGVQMGAINGNLPYVAASRYGAGDGTPAPLAFMTDATERARLDTGGNLGIGTMSPGARLDVAGTLRGQMLTLPAAPTSANIPASYWTAVKRTDDGSVKMCANDGGTIKCVAMQ